MSTLPGKLSLSSVLESDKHSRSKSKTKSSTIAASAGAGVGTGDHHGEHKKKSSSSHATERGSSASPTRHGSPNHRKKAAGAAHQHQTVEETPDCVIDISGKHLDAHSLAIALEQSAKGKGIDAHQILLISHCELEDDSINALAGPLSHPLFVGFDLSYNNLRHDSFVNLTNLLKVRLQYTHKFVVFNVVIIKM
jgi:hypothetical protein